jgi:hypothetical protein
VRLPIIDVDLPGKGIIEFGRNSWRGDHFAPTLYQWLKERSDEDTRQSNLFYCEMLLGKG